MLHINVWSIGFFPIKSMFLKIDEMVLLVMTYLLLISLLCLCASCSAFNAFAIAWLDVLRFCLFLL